MLRGIVAARTTLHGEIQPRSVEMAQGVKCASVNQSSDPEHPQKELGAAVYVCSPNAGQRRSAVPRDLLSSQAS